MKAAKMKSFVRAAVTVTLVSLLTLPLLGCGEDAESVKEGIIKGLETESSRAEGSLTVRSNMPEEELEEEWRLLFSLLKEGISMEMNMESLNSMHIELSSPAEEKMREEGIWPYEESLQADIYIQEGKTAFKTAADPVYLLMDPADVDLLAPGEEPGFEEVWDEEYYEEQVQLMLEFLVPFMRDFDYRLSHVEHVGTEELVLPDGTVETEVISVHLDHDEILEITAYTARNLAESEPFRKYILNSVVGQMERMKEGGMIPSEELPSEEEINEMAEEVYQEFTALLHQLAELAESPVMLQEQYGLELALVEDYYLDAEGFIRKTVSSFGISAEHESLKQVLGTSRLDVELHAESYAFDINEPVQVDFPPAEEMVSLYGIMADPELAEELGEGPLYSLTGFISSLMEVPGAPAMGKNLIINPEEEVYLLDGEPLDMETPPYYEDDVLMLPLRQLGELAGGEVSWDAETRQITFVDGDKVMLLTPGSQQVKVDGKALDFNVPVTIKEGRTMVPSEFVEQFAEHLQVEDGFVIIVL